MNKKEREIFYKLLIELFKESPDRIRERKQQKGKCNENDKTNAGVSIHKPAGKTDSTN